MKENQQLEWKESWRDEFLRWICGFANAEGGTLHIGRNDKGGALVCQMPRSCWKTSQIKSAMSLASSSP